MARIASATKRKIEAQSAECAFFVRFEISNGPNIILTYPQIKEMPVKVVM